MAKKALLLSGGAPNATLMAGALHSFLEHGVEFDLISTSGAGALIGLLYTVPKGQTPATALENTQNFGIQDWIYSFLPVNYKVFRKSSPVSELYETFAQTWLQLNPLYTATPKNQGERFLSDWQQLLVSMFAPSDLTPASQGLAANVPFIEEVIDMDALKTIEPMFYVNAYNITKRHMDNFYNRCPPKGQCDPNKIITGDHLRASFAYPFIYPPFELNGDYYYEGAAHDALNYQVFFNAEEEEKALHPEIDTIVIMDIIGADKLIRTPRNLWDAYVISIITPLTEIARDDTKIFELKYNKNPDGSEKRKLLKVKFDIADWEHVLDWSYSNLSTLYQIGQVAGKKFCEENAECLDLS